MCKLTIPEPLDHEAPLGYIERTIRLNGQATDEQLASTIGIDVDTVWYIRVLNDVNILF